MTVYIDSLFIINLFMDSALLVLVQLIAKRNAGCIRVALGAVILALYSLGSVFEGISFLYGIIPKAVVCCLILLFVFGKSGYLKTLIVFWAAVFILGGVVYALSASANPYDYISVPNESARDITPVLSLIGCIMLYALLYLMKRITVRSFSRERIIIGIDIKYLNRHYPIKALIDTGCCLCEPLSGDAVMLAEKSVFGEIPRAGCEINITTAAGEKKLPLIFPESTAGSNDTYRVKNAVPIVLSDKKLNRDGLYNAIINPDATEDIGIIQSKPNFINKINSILSENRTSERMKNLDINKKI